MKREFRTEVYLLTGDKLRVVRSEGGIEDQPGDDPVEFTPVGGVPRWGGSFFCAHGV